MMVDVLKSAVRGVLAFCLASRVRFIALCTSVAAGLTVALPNMAGATEYKVEYKTLTEAAEKNFGEAITAVLVILGVIIGVMLGIRVVKKWLKSA
jgi:hypothetical protein